MNEPTHRPKALDLFCGAGGASMGIHRAGFDVTGVDIKPQPRYPFKFIQADALTFDLSGYDFIWASPPCQRYTISAKIHNSAMKHPDLVPGTRDRLSKSGKPWIIENVVGAPLHNPILLCGIMFGLRVLRHRLFESNCFMLAPAHSQHNGITGSKDGYSSFARGQYICVAGHNFNRKEAAFAMGIDWMKSAHELCQAIPPAYSEYLGRQIIKQITKP